MKRLAQFLRSAIPTDPWQLVFLVGLVFLTISPRLAWWHISDEYEALAVERIYQPVKDEWNAYSVVAGMLIAVGAAAGFAACFWPGRRPERRALITVILPTFLGLAAFLGRNFYLERLSRSILENVSWNFMSLQKVIVKAWGFGPGIHFCVFGILLAAVFTLRVHKGISQLPITMPVGAPVGGEGAVLGERSKALLWLVVGPQAWLLGLPFLPLGLFMPASASFLAWGKAYLILIVILQSLFTLGALFILIGGEWRRTVGELFRFPRPQWLGLGLALPVGLATLVPAGQYLYDRARWAAFYFGKMAPPAIHSYFSFPSPWLLLDFFAAFYEEVIFRGVLQTALIEKLGIWRGVLLSAMAWAAFHFYGDSHNWLDDWGVLLGLSVRVLMCLSVGFVLSWLTLRSKSILPAAITHALHNILLGVGTRPPFPGGGTLLLWLWAILAVILFRFWPVDAEVNQADQVVSESPETVA